MQRIASGAVTDLVTRTEAPPEVLVAYRLPGLWHLIMTALGTHPAGKIVIDGSRVQVTESSRRRSFVHTMPTRAVAALTTELTRRVLGLILGIIFLGMGLTGALLAVSHRQHLGWWPAVDKALTANQLFALAGGLGGLALLCFIGYAFSRRLELIFNGGGPKGTRIRLRRSWRFPLPLEATRKALGTAADIIVAASHPGRAADDRPPDRQPPTGTLASDPPQPPGPPT